MLGVGGSSLLISTAAQASPIVPLFSGKESKIWTPEHTSLTRSHLVLLRPKKVPWKVVPAPEHADPFYRHMHRDAWPRVGGERSAQGGGPLYHRTRLLRHLDEEWWRGPPPVRVEFKQGQDPHDAFYRAAMKMREDFSKESQRRLLEVPEYRRPHSTLVTLVDTPIFAGPVSFSELPIAPGKNQLIAQISYTPYVVDLTYEELELNGWEVYSESGQYPIEVPTDVDMEKLFSLDQHIIRGQRAPSSLGGSLLIGGSP